MLYYKESLLIRRYSSLNDVVCFLLEGFLRERIGKSAEIRSVRTGTELKIEIKETEVERDQLGGWLRRDFRNYEIRDLPFGFLPHNPDLSELLVVTVSANQEFNSQVPLSSFMTIQEMGSLLEHREGAIVASSFYSPKRRFFSRIEYMIKKYPQVGIGVMIFKKGKVLLGKRKGSHGKGEYAFPGGHLDYMETIEDCSKRETLEETGIKIKNVRFQFLANVCKYKPKHYIHVGVVADYKNGKVQLREPEKCEGWDWYSLNKLPKPLFWMAKLAVDSYRTKRIYFDKQ